jgi:hypothetical protein
VNKNKESGDTSGTSPLLYIKNKGSFLKSEIDTYFPNLDIHTGFVAPAKG